MSDTIQPLTEKDGKSKDLVRENIEKLMQLFPEIVTDGNVDFETLQEVLGEFKEDSKERYSFIWNGKSKARKLAMTPSRGTLRPAPEESVNWGSTENLFIEGDNLEVLKLLQRSYHGKVKMIYIDPPYNTGNDFVYNDDFKDTIKNYKLITNQIDEEGRNLSNNPETSGRYHTDWLNMMFPRVILARELMEESGCICVSISDIELNNLKSLLNEVFGEENYVNTISVLSKVAAGASGGGEDKRLKKNIEYILIYAKNMDSFNNLTHVYKDYDLLDLIKSMEENDESWKYTSIFLDADEREFLEEIKDGEGNSIKIFKRKNVNRTTINQVMKNEGLSEKEAYFKYYDRIFSDTNAQSSIRARVKDAVGKLGSGEVLEVDYVPRSGKDAGKNTVRSYISPSVRRVIWLSDVAEKRDNKIIKLEKRGTLWDDFDYNNVGKEGGISFPNGKKPIEMLKTCLSLQECTDGIVLDFFAGSSSMAHAVIEKNLEDNGKRRFIMVQLPEVIKDNKENASLLQVCKQFDLKNNIAEIGKQRIRNVNKSTTELNFNGDTGFKVYKLDASNLKPWDSNFNEVQLSIEDSIENIKPDRSEQDVLYEILLKYGLDLSLPIEENEIAGSKVFVAGAGALFICLAPNIDLDVVEGITKLKEELEPELTRVVFRDSGFKDDVVKTNAVQILKQHGIEDVRSI